MLKKLLFSLAGSLAFALGGMLLPLAAQAASLSLTPASGNYDNGQTFDVQILLDTQGAAIDGVDVKYLNFDPRYLDVVDSDNSTAGVQIQPGSLMTSTFTNAVNLAGGKIDFAQIVTPGTTYTGSGVLATVTFKVKAGGTTALSFSNTRGETKDSNIASQGKDVLTTSTGATFTLTGPPPVGGVGIGSLRLINDNGTFYVIQDGQRLGITNPGMLFSYGFTFGQAKAATSQDRQLPLGALLTPNDGSLVKSVQDPTVYLISGRKRYGFVSEAVFKGLGYKFQSVLVVTDPELQILARATNLDDAAKSHLPGTDIIRNGTVYFIGSDNLLHGYPSQAVFNSWHLPNDFSQVVPANQADMALGVGNVSDLRVVE